MASEKRGRSAEITLYLSFDFVAQVDEWIFQKYYCLSYARSKWTLHLCTPEPTCPGELLHQSVRDEMESRRDVTTLRPVYIVRKRCKTISQLHTARSAGVALWGESWESIAHRRRSMQARNPLRLFNHDTDTATPNKMLHYGALAFAHCEQTLSSLGIRIEIGRRNAFFDLAAFLYERSVKISTSLR